ncbi:MAG: hypothetical protein R6X16_15060 [Anaerolineae bacterium]
MTEYPGLSDATARSGSNRNCLIITVIVVGLALLGCIVTVILTLVVVRNYQGLPPGALETPDVLGAPGMPDTPEAAGPPDATVSLNVLSDGCAVERGEVQGTDDVRMLTWVIADELGVSVLERNAENEFRYRYYAGGDYTVTIKAWYDGAYWPISDTVAITCP